MRTKLIPLPVEQRPLKSEQSRNYQCVFQCFSFNVSSQNVSKKRRCLCLLMWMPVLALTVLHAREDKKNAKTRFCKLL